MTALDLGKFGRVASPITTEQGVLTVAEYIAVDASNKQNLKDKLDELESSIGSGGLSQVALPIFEIKEVENVNNSSVTTGFIGVVYNTTSGKFIAAEGTVMPGLPPTVTGYYSSWAATDKYPAPAVYAAKNTLYLKGTELYGFVDGSLQLVGDGNSGGGSGGGLPEGVSLNGTIAIGTSESSRVFIGNGGTSQGANVLIGGNVFIKDDVALGTRITDGTSIGIENNTKIGISPEEGVTLGTNFGVRIGKDVLIKDFVSIGKNVTIPDGFDGSNISGGGGGGLPDGVVFDGKIYIGTAYDRKSDVFINKKVSIDENVWIEKNVGLGEGVFINCTPTDDVDALNVFIGNSVVVGNGVAIGDTTKIDPKVGIGGNVVIGTAGNPEETNVFIGKNVYIPDDFDGSKVSGAIIIQ